MKKEIKVVAIALAALIFFLGGVVVGTTNGGVNIKVEYAGGSVNTGATQQADPVTTTAAPVTTTAAPVTETTTAAPSGDATTAAPSGDATAPSADATQSSGITVPSTPAEVAAAYNKAINDYKAYTGNVTTKKVETIDIGVKDLPAMVASAVNKVVESFTGTTENEWTFTNGKDAEGKVPGDRIIPGGRDAAVVPEGLVSATATPNADGGYTMTLKFVAEKSTFNGTTNTSEPTYHMGAMDPLNLGTLELDPITIAEADLSYPGADTVATVDAQGRLVSLHNYLPLEGYGTGGVLGINLTINMGGSMTSDWTMTYA